MLHGKGLSHLRQVVPRPVLHAGVGQNRSRNLFGTLLKEIGSLAGRSLDELPGRLKLFFSQSQKGVDPSTYAGRS